MTPERRLRSTGLNSARKPSTAILARDGAVLRHDERSVSLERSVSPVRSG
jgi:hypothetical protein